MQQGSPSRRTVGWLVRSSGHETGPVAGSGRRRRTAAWLAMGLLLVGLRYRPASAEVVTLKNGLQLRGELAKFDSVNQNPLVKFQPTPNVAVTKIVMLDDGLRRTFVSSNQIRAGGLAPDSDVGQVQISIPKRTVHSGRRIASVGPIIEITPFDDYGNRVFSMRGPRGRIDVIQGITSITPLYAKVEGLVVENAFSWSMRISTASIPRQTLTRILLRNIDQADMQKRLRVVTLYVQAERYRDALVELERIIADFPNTEDLQKQRQRLNQLVVTDVIRELQLRRDAGQYIIVEDLLKNFPQKDVAGELLLQVGEMLAELDNGRKQTERVHTLLDQHIAALADDKSRGAIAAIADEVRRELNRNNVDRAADYLRLADDQTLKPDQKLSLLLSGWLLGSGAGIDNLATALSLVEVRQVVRQYLVADTPGERDALLQRLRELEGSSPQNLARLLAHMKPPVATEPPADAPAIPNFLRLAVPAVGMADEVRYDVQLPPEYDPYRRYPCIVTLHGAASTPQSQIDWWAGPFDPDRNVRVGQATRHGYVVIAPAWAKPGQTAYGCTLTEHAAVLAAVRDACRRFSIDTDRIFLTGYSMGGDAAWDIGLAHPDLWAGVIPIVATAQKYVSRYWPNGRGLPMYFVGGELDGNRIATNARELDRYLEKAGYDTIYVEYRGRGHEHFSDEIQRIFEWMQLQRRNFFPREFEVVSMRPWDRFFWWLELDGFPATSMVLPASWPDDRGPKAREAKTEARALENNSIWIQTAATDVVLWLSPDLVDFSQRVSVNGRKVDVVPSILDMLEDTRTRCDRQHPFWVRLQPNVGRRS